MASSKTISEKQCLSTQTTCHMTSRSTRMVKSQRSVRLGPHNEALWKDNARRQCDLQSHYLQSDHGGRGSHTRNTVVGLQSDTQITHAIIFTETINLLQKVEFGIGCPDWHTAMHCMRLQRLLRIYCHGYAGVSWNERVDRLEGTADIASGRQLGTVVGNF